MCMLLRLRGYATCLDPKLIWHMLLGSVYNNQVATEIDSAQISMHTIPNWHKIVSDLNSSVLC